MTRRSLLAASAGAVGGGLLRPHRALALFGGPPSPTLAKLWLGVLTPEGRTVELQGAADLVGIEWQTPARAGVWLRFRDRYGEWSGWVPAASSGHGPDARPTAGRQVGEPIWTGGATAVQVRATRTLHGALLHLVDASGGESSAFLGPSAVREALSAGLPLATPKLSAGPGQPPIIARRAWAQGQAPPRVAPGYGAVRMAFVHHTDNPNGYAASDVPAMLRAIYAFHRYVNGWDDIGYNFVIDLYGRTFEARAGGIDEPVVGAHAGGYNLASTGIAVLGTFSTARISKPARAALKSLLAWKLSLHGVPAQGTVVVRVNPAGASYSRFPANARVPLPRIAGHCDGDSTDCPGKVLYGELPPIRASVHRLAPNPTTATLSLSTPTAAPGAPPTPGTGGGSTGSGPAPSAPSQVLSGVLARLHGTPLSNAPVLIQERMVSQKGEVVSELTLAETTTDRAGRWKLDATPVAPAGKGIWLRALYPGGSGFGASVSEPLYVPERVSLTAPAAN